MNKKGKCRGGNVTETKARFLVLRQLDSRGTSLPRRHREHFEVLYQG